MYIYIYIHIGYIYIEPVPTWEDRRGMMKGDSVGVEAVLYIYIYIHTHIYIYIYISGRFCAFELGHKLGPAFKNLQKLLLAVCPRSRGCNIDNFIMIIVPVM